MEKEKIDTLSVFTLEELREEIKRREKIQRQKAVKDGALKAKYYEWEGKVTKIYGTHMAVPYISFDVMSDELLEKRGINTHTFNLKPGIFNKKNMPKVGDTVILAVRVRKKDTIIWIINSKIIKIKK